MKRPAWLLILFAVEALIAFVWTFLTPAEKGREIFLWLSLPRLLLAAFLLGLVIATFLIILYTARTPARTAAALVRLEAALLRDNWLAGLLLALLVVPVCVALAVLQVILVPLDYAAYHTWAPDTFPLLHSLVYAVLPLLSLVLVGTFELGVFFAARYRQVLVARRAWTSGSVLPPLIIGLMALATGFQWIILVFQLRFLVNIPGWYWKISPLPFTAGDFWFILGAAILIAGIYWMLVVRRRAAPAIVLIFVLGLFLQFGVGLMSGGGFDAVSERYFSTYHKTYVLQASQNRLTIPEAIRNYEQVFGTHAFTSTKPPGLMSFYIGLDQLVNRFPSAFPDGVRYARLSQFIIVAFPILAMLMVFLLFLFTRRFLVAGPEWVPIISPLLFVLCPSVALFSLFPDQAIYPLVFLLGVWLTVTTIQRKSVLLSFLLGIFLYTAVFFAFTMLPLYPFAGLYLVLHARQERARGRWIRSAWTALAIAAGTLVLFLLLLLFLNYNFIPRFERTMAINHSFDFYLRLGRQPPAAPEAFSTRLGQIVRAAWFNNLDFAAAIGFPIYILFVLQAVRLMKRVFSDKSQTGDIILLSLLFSFIILNLAGTAQGEVPRLWLFWLPLMVVLAASELDPHVRRHPSLLLWLSAIQLITILLTYHFQDLRM